MRLIRIFFLNTVPVVVFTESLGRGQNSTIQSFGSLLRELIQYYQIGGNEIIAPDFKCRLVLEICTFNQISFHSKEET